MRANAAFVVRFSAGLLGLVTIAWVLTGQAAKPAPQGIPTDWTHQHVIFSRPATVKQIGQVTADPRYWQQFYRQTVPRVLSDPAMSGDESSMNLGFPGTGGRKVHRDWSRNLGSGATVGAGNYPAKYSFKINTANCGSATTPDLVVFNTGSVGFGNASQHRRLRQPLWRMHRNRAFGLLGLQYQWPNPDLSRVLGGWLAGRVCAD